MVYLEVIFTNNLFHNLIFTFRFYHEQLKFCPINRWFLANWRERFWLMEINTFFSYLGIWCDWKICVSCWGEALRNGSLKRRVNVGWRAEKWPRKASEKEKKASNTENSGARAVFGKGGQGYWVFWRWFNSCYGFHNPSLLVSKLSLVSRLLKVLNFYPLVRV